MLSLFVCTLLVHACSTQQNSPEGSAAASSGQGEQSLENAAKRTPESDEKREALTFEEFRKSLIGNDTVALIRVKTGPWKPFSTILERAEKNDAGTSATREFIRSLAESGPVDFAREYLPPEFLTPEAIDQLKAERDVYVRVDQVLPAELEAAYRGGIFLPFPGANASDGVDWNVTLFLPMKDPDAALNSYRDREEVFASAVGDYVAVSQNVVSTNAPAGLPESAASDDTPAMRAFWDSSGLAAAYIRSRAAIETKHTLEWIRRARGWEGIQPYFKHQRALQFSEDSAETYTIPPQAIEFEDHAIVLAAEGEGVAIETTSTPTSLGAAGLEAFASPGEVRLPGYTLPHDDEAKPWMSFRMAIAQKELREQLSKVTVPKDTNSGTRVRLDEFHEQPHAWASPMRIVLSYFDAAPSAAFAEHIAIFADLWERRRAPDGEVVGALFTGVDKPDVLLKQLPNTSTSDLTATNDQVTLLHARGRHVDGAKATPREAWEKLQLGTVSVVADLEKRHSYSRSGRTPAALGTVELQLNAGKHSLQTKLSAGVSAPDRITDSDHDWTPRPIELAGCGTPLVNAVAAYQIELNKSWRLRDDPEAETKVSSAYGALMAQLDACGADGEESSLNDRIAGHASWQLALFRLHRHANPAEIQKAFKSACDHGFPTTCDEPLKYWAGKDCEDGKSEEVLLTKQVIEKGTPLTRDMVEVVCAYPQRDLVPAAELEESIGRPLKSTAYKDELLWRSQL